MYDELFNDKNIKENKKGSIVYFYTPDTMSLIFELANIPYQDREKFLKFANNYKVYHKSFGKRADQKVVGLCKQLTIIAEKFKSQKEEKKITIKEEKLADKYDKIDDLYAYPLPIVFKIAEKNLGSTIENMKEFREKAIKIKDGKMFFKEKLKENEYTPTYHSWRTWGY